MILKPAPIKETALAGLLSTLFRRPDRLTALSRGADREKFVATLQQSEVIVLGALRSDGVDVDDLNEDTLADLIDRAAHEMTERTSLEPFVYEQEGVRLIPFFSSERHAQTFCGEYSKERRRVFPFETATVRGAVLGTLSPDLGIPVLNARTPDEYRLTDAEVTRLRDRQTG